MFRNLSALISIANNMQISQKTYEIQKLLNRELWQEVLDYLPTHIWRNEKEREITNFCMEKLGIQQPMIEDDDFCEELD